MPARMPAWIKNARIADSARPLRRPTKTDDEITPSPSRTAAMAQPRSPMTKPTPMSTHATQKKMSAKMAMPKFLAAEPEKQSRIACVANIALMHIPTPS